MPELNIDGLDFVFPSGWQASKYDEWSYYRNQFAKQRDGLKAVDALVVTPEKCAYLIEVKDYRHPDTDKPSQLPQAVADKVLHTLAALLPARLLANDEKERAFASAILDCQQLQIVLHVEQPPRHRPIIDMADLKQQLRHLLRAIDPHVKVSCAANMANLPWTLDS